MSLRRTYSSYDTWDGITIEPPIRVDANSYDIYKVSQLRYILNNYSNYNALTKFTQRANLDVNYHIWNVIEQFRSIYNGNGFSIENLTSPLVTLNTGAFDNIEISYLLCNSNSGTITNSSFTTPICITNNSIISKCTVFKGFVSELSTNPSGICNLNSGTILNSKMIDTNDSRALTAGICYNNSGVINGVYNYVDNANFGFNAIATNASTSKIINCINAGSSCGFAFTDSNSRIENCVNIGDNCNYLAGTDCIIVNCSNSGVNTAITNSSLCTNCTNAITMPSPFGANVNNSNCYCLTGSTNYGNAIIADSIASIPVSTASYNLVIVLYPLGSNTSNCRIILDKINNVYTVNGLLGNYSASINF